MHQRSCFITLTYNEQNETINLDYKHVQDFMKRLRKRKGPCRFFAAGEYGKKELRPHWHILLFGVNFEDLTLLKNKIGGDLYDSKELNALWGKGYTSVGEVNYTTAGYVAKQSNKAQENKQKKDTNE
jgi:hypothetical protein